MYSHRNKFGPEELCQYLLVIVGSKERYIHIEAKSFISSLFHSLSSYPSICWLDDHASYILLHIIVCDVINVHRGSPPENPILVYYVPFYIINDLKGSHPHRHDLLCKFVLEPIEAINNIHIHDTAWHKLPCFTGLSPHPPLAGYYLLLSIKIWRCHMLNDASQLYIYI